MFRTPRLAPSGLPCNAPPWGTVAAVDLFEGKKIWDVPLGSFIPGMKTGTITLGGPTVTAGGGGVTAAGKDKGRGGVGSGTGPGVWEKELPGGGGARPRDY